MTLLQIDYVVSQAEGNEPPYSKADGGMLHVVDVNWGKNRYRSRY